MKKCLICGQGLIKHKNESKKRYDKKQFCSTECSRVFMKKHKVGWWAKQTKEFTDTELEHPEEWT